jgi:hypothetical protein
MFVASGKIHLIGRSGGTSCAYGAFSGVYWMEYSRISLATGLADVPTTLPVVGCQSPTFGRTATGALFVASAAGHDPERGGLELSTSADDGKRWIAAAASEPLPWSLGLATPTYGVSAGGELEVYAANTSGSTTSISRVRRTFDGSAQSPGDPAGIAERVTELRSASTSSPLAALRLIPSAQATQLAAVVGLTINSGTLSSVAVNDWQPVTPSAPVEVQASSGAAFPLVGMSDLSTSPSGMFSTFTASYAGQTEQRVFLRTQDGVVRDYGALPNSTVSMVDDNGVLIAQSTDPGTGTCARARTRQFWNTGAGWYGPVFVGWCRSMYRTSVSTAVNQPSGPLPISFAAFWSDRLQVSPGVNWAATSLMVSFCSRRTTAATRTVRASTDGTSLL